MSLRELGEGQEMPHHSLFHLVFLSYSQLGGQVSLRELGIGQEMPHHSPFHLATGWKTSDCLVELANGWKMFHSVLQLVICWKKLPDCYQFLISLMMRLVVSTIAVINSNSSNAFVTSSDP